MKVSINSPSRVEEADVRARLAEAGFPSAIVQRSSASAQDLDTNRFLIRIQEERVPDNNEVHAQERTSPVQEAAIETEGAAVTQEQTAAAQANPAEVEDNGQEQQEEQTPTVSSQVLAALAPLGTADGNREAIIPEMVETVGPAVGRQLQVDAQYAILYALLFIVAYLWFRFELKFALGAVAALIHDVLVTVGLFALMERQLTMPVIAALLTIIGYSLNDTIVVFDRIREDLRLYRGRGLSYAAIMDLSINQTLSRTLLTSLTTLFVVVVLAVFGGEVIRDFALALIIGVIVGTYSSIFVASPLVYLLHGRQRGRPEAEDTKRRGPRKQKEAST